MDSVPSQDLKAFLLLNRLKIDGRRRVVALLAEGKPAYEILDQMITEDFFKGAEVPGGSVQAFSPEQEIERCISGKIKIMTFADPAYPRLLKEVADPPLVLYVRGEIERTDRNSIAIVGTRHPSFYGLTQAKRFSKALALGGLTVVSGLARGIDQAAHEAAIEVSFGRTLAVLGSGLDVIYPRENEKLFERIAAQGAVLSEYPLGTPPLPENFPRRNRILSGLSYGVLVVEAHSRSGSLITAHQAVEQGREVFALPGPVDQLTSHGTHRLLKEGACLVEGPEDILEALADHLKRENGFRPETVEAEIPPEKMADPVHILNVSQAIAQNPVPDAGLPAAIPSWGEGTRLSEDAVTVEEVLREEGPLAPDGILDFSGLDPLRLPALLLQLELVRKIKKTSDGKYTALRG